MASVRHVVKKLRRMGPHEVLWRVRTLAGQVAEQQQHRFGIGRDPRPHLRGEPPRYPYPFLATDALNEVVAALRREPAYEARLVQRADALVRGEFEFFGQPFVFPPDDVPWTADPITGRVWPMAFHTQVDIFSGNIGHGDVKFVWELNRHHFLVTLGQAWKLTGDARYAETALRWLDSWHAANPFRMGINWTSALEHAVRSLSWLTTAGLLDDAPAFSRDRRVRLATALHQHGLFLAAHLSFYFSPYNHLIGEAAALHAIGSLVPSLPRARRWRTRGWQILVDEVPRQFHADGGTVEQAFGYHHFTLGFYLQGLLIARRSGATRVPDHFINRLRAATRFAEAITRPDHFVPMVGDADEGKALELDQWHPWDFSGLRTAARAATGLVPGRDEPWNDQTSPDAAWVAGVAALTRPSRLAESPPAATDARRLPASGYVIQQDTRHGHWLLFDAGNIAHGVPQDDEVSAAHGHADLLTFELVVGGRPRLIDPGFLTYNGAVEWHRYFRDTQAHNALVVDDSSQAVYRGRLKWSHGASATLREARSSPALHYVEGRHAAYARGAAPLVHTRAIAWVRPDVWIVCDHVDGEGVHQLDRFLHFANDAVVCDRALASTTDDSASDIDVYALEPDVEAVLVAGMADPSGGWIAERYERKIPGAVLRHRVTRRGSATLFTVLAKRGAADVRAAVVVEDDTWTTVRVPLAGGRHVTMLWAPEPVHTSAGPVTLQAGRALVVETSAGGVDTAAFLDATAVIAPALPAFQSSTPVAVHLTRDGATAAWAPWPEVPPA